MTPFKDLRLRKVYDHMTANPPPLPSRALWNDYFRGLRFPNGARPPRGTLSYAAWAAGRDAARRQARARAR